MNDKEIINRITPLEVDGFRFWQKHNILFMLEEARKDEREKLKSENAELKKCLKHHMDLIRQNAELKESIEDFLKKLDEVVTGGSKATAR